MGYQKTYRKVEHLITNIVNEEGINPSLKGFYYITEAVNLLLKEKDRMGAITKEVYGPIADSNQTTIACVERSIRFAIKKKMESCNTEDFQKDSVTNKVFLAKILQKAEQQQFLVI